MSDYKHNLSDAEKADAVKRFSHTEYVRRDWRTGKDETTFSLGYEVNGFADQYGNMTSEWVKWAAQILSFLTEEVFEDGCLRQPAHQPKRPVALTIEDLTANFEAEADEAEQTRIEEMQDPEGAKWWRNHKPGEHAWSNETMDTARRWLAEAARPYAVWAIMQETQQAAFDAARENALALALGHEGDYIAKASETALDKAIKALDKRYTKARKEAAEAQAQAEAEAETRRAASWDASPLGGQA